MHGKRQNVCVECYKDPKRRHLATSICEHLARRYRCKICNAAKFGLVNNKEPEESIYTELSNRQKQVNQYKDKKQPNLASSSSKVKPKSKYVYGKNKSEYNPKTNNVDLSYFKNASGIIDKSEGKLLDKLLKTTDKKDFDKLLQTLLTDENNSDFQFPLNNKQKTNLKTRKGTQKRTVRREPLSRLPNQPQIQAPSTQIQQQSRIPSSRLPTQQQPQSRIPTSRLPIQQSRIPSSRLPTKTLVPTQLPTQIQAIQSLYPVENSQVIPQNNIMSSQISSTSTTQAVNINSTANYANDNPVEIKVEPTTSVKKPPLPPPVTRKPSEYAPRKAHKRK